MPDSINNERFRKLLLTFPHRAVGLLYDTYFKSLVSMSTRFTRDREASVDIVQEVLIQVWEKSGLLSDPHEQSIEHYLVRVVRNRSITWFRLSAKGLENLKELNGSSVNRSERSVESRIIEQEVIEKIRRIISTFPMREKQCLLLRIDEQMTTSQMALSLGISVKAVERSLTSANKRLRLHWRQGEKSGK